MLRASSGIWSSRPLSRIRFSATSGTSDGAACGLGDGQMQPGVQPPVVVELRAADVGQPRPQHFAFGGGQRLARRHPRGTDLEDLPQPQRVVDLGSLSTRG